MVEIMNKEIVLPRLTRDQGPSLAQMAAEADAEWHNIGPARGAASSFDSSTPAPPPTPAPPVVDPLLRFDPLLTW